MVICCTDLHALHQGYQAGVHNVLPGGLLGHIIESFQIELFELVELYLGDGLQRQVT